VTDNSGTPVGHVDLPGENVPVERTVGRTTVYMNVYSTRQTPLLLGGKPMSTPLEVFVRTEHQRAQSTLGVAVFAGMAGLSNPARGAFEDSIQFVSNTVGK
jgi:hypothetical protein